MNGKVTGNFWIGLLGNNGFLHGEADENGMATGDNLIYIYPDGKTALRGSFFDTYMIDAKYVDVLEYAYDEYGILYAKTFTKPLNNYTYQYDPPTNISFGGGNTNLIPDPYEMEMVKMAPSSIPESGDGVFLRKAVKSLTIVAYFSTYLFR